MGTTGLILSIQAVVVEPTLELAEQTFECISDLCKRVPSPSLTCQLLAGAAGSKRSKSTLFKL
jgi:superfamily II DNA/RNA helicase